MSANGFILVEVGKSGTRARLIEKNPPPILTQIRRPNIAGYKDEEGIFHPIRWDPDYDYRRAGESKRYSTNRSRSARAVRFYLRRTTAAARKPVKKAAKTSRGRTAKKTRKSRR